MRKIILPKKHIKGLCVYCKKCRINNPNCKHQDERIFRAVFYIPGGNGAVRTKLLKAENYEDAIVEAIDFKKELAESNYEKSTIPTETGNDYNIVGAILKYNQYLQGDSEYAHLNKNISVAYRKEKIGYCTLFAEHLKLSKDIMKLRVNSIGRSDVSTFYTFLGTKYSPKTFNKCLNEIKAFFHFLISIEEIDMKNPFDVFVPKQIDIKPIETITRDEFETLLSTIDTTNPITTKGSKKTKTSMYFPWLKNGFKLLLLLGVRREEIVTLKWSDIFVTENGIKFIMINNLKVDRIKKTYGKKKYIPINADLEALLIEMGMNMKSNGDEYILFPDRGNMNHETIMSRLTKSFTYYKKAAKINKNITLKNLRKTYISWVNQVMGNQTGTLTSHSTGEVLDKYYLDPTILSTIETGALKIKIFGENPTQSPTQITDTETKKDSRFNVSP